MWEDPVNDVTLNFRSAFSECVHQQLAYCAQNTAPRVNNKCCSDYVTFEHIHNKNEHARPPVKEIQKKICDY